MRDEFIEMVQKRFEEIPQEFSIQHGRHLLPAIEREQARAHPFYFLKHQIMQWWAVMHG